MCATNHNHMMYDSWDVECCRHHLSFSAISCPLTLLLTPKLKIWKNVKKTPGDIIVLHMCIANDNHDVCSWDMEQDRRNFLSFWTIFYPFTPKKTTKKIKIKKNEKNAERYHFIQVYQKSWTHAILFLRYGAWQM